ncbi:hypothetical protein [Paenibacillus sanfengchensis]|uniref:hypothetical protein n=1 Tax=Paenibacillus sanfengchensis TaxID=3119819 RepID=UPI002FDF8921
MKRIVQLMLTMMLFSGCDIKEQYNNQSIYEDEGYILEIAENRILVVENKYLNKTWKEIMSDYRIHASGLSPLDYQMYNHGRSSDN